MRKTSGSTNEILRDLESQIDLRSVFGRPIHTVSDLVALRLSRQSGLAPIAAVPSNCPHVLVRILHGQERESYAVTYREAQQALAAELSEMFETRRRAYLLLKHHGQELCKRSKPLCKAYPVASDCAYSSGRNRGKSARA